MHDPELNIYPRPLHGRKAIENARSWHFWSTLSCSQKPAFKSSTRILVVETYHFYWIDIECKWAFANNFSSLFEYVNALCHEKAGVVMNVCYAAFITWCQGATLVRWPLTSFSKQILEQCSIINSTLKNALVFKMTFKVASVLFDGGSELWDALLLKSTNVASSDAAIAASTIVCRYETRCTMICTCGKCVHD